MEKLGDMWMRKLEGAQLSPHQLAEAISRNEGAARDFLTGLTNRWVQDGIEKAVKERSTEIILDAPMSILGTNAFDEFLRWATNEKLGVSPSGLIFKEGSPKDCDIALRVTPLKVS